MIHLLHTVKALEGRTSGLQPPQRSDPPFPASALSLTLQALFVPSEQSGGQSCIAVCSVELCGYANVSRLLGVLLNG